MHNLEALTCSHAAAVVQMRIGPAAVLCFQFLFPAALASLLPAACSNNIIFSSCTFIDLHDLHHLWHVNTAYHNAEFGRLTVLLLLS